MKKSQVLYLLMFFSLLYITGCNEKEDVIEKEDIFEGNEGTFTDSRDGQVYKWVRIGEQIWMAENLKYLPDVVGPDSSSSSLPFYYVYGYDGTDVAAAKATANYQAYGVLYNWAAAMAGSASSDDNPSGVQGVCPIGWHLPSHEEWKQLEMYLGMSQAAADSSGNRGTNEGSKLAGNAELWANGELENDVAFGISGFNALPGGYLQINPRSFIDLGCNASFWSATDKFDHIAWDRRLRYDNSKVYVVDLFRTYFKDEGFSVRCIKD